MKIIAWLCGIFGCNFADKLELAINRASNLHAEVHKYKERSEHLSKSLSYINPYNDWNLFALLMQKREDALNELHTATQRWAQSEARVQELINELKPEEPEHALSADIDFDPRDLASCLAKFGGNNPVNFGGSIQRATVMGEDMLLRTVHRERDAGGNLIAEHTVAVEEYAPGTERYPVAGVVGGYQFGGGRTVIADTLADAEAVRGELNDTIATLRGCADADDRIYIGGAASRAFYEGTKPAADADTNDS